MSYAKYIELAARWDPTRNSLALNVYNVVNCRERDVPRLVDGVLVYV